MRRKKFTLNRLCSFSATHLLNLLFNLFFLSIFFSDGALFRSLSPFAYKTHRFARARGGVKGNESKQKTAPVISVFFKSVFVFSLYVFENLSPSFLFSLSLSLCLPAASALLETQDVRKQRQTGPPIRRTGVGGTHPNEKRGCGRGAREPKKVSPKKNDFFFCISLSFLSPQIPAFSLSPKQTQKGHTQSSSSTRNKKEKRRKKKIPPLFSTACPRTRPAASARA